MILLSYTKWKVILGKVNNFSKLHLTAREQMTAHCRVPRTRSRSVQHKNMRTPKLLNQLGHSLVIVSCYHTRQNCLFERNYDANWTSYLLPLEYVTASGPNQTHTPNMPEESDIASHCPFLATRSTTILSSTQTFSSTTLTYLSQNLSGMSPKSTKLALVRSWPPGLSYCRWDLFHNPNTVTSFL